jgi:hypothetical protein
MQCKKPTTTPIGYQGHNTNTILYCRLVADYADNIVYTG